MPPIQRRVTAADGPTGVLEAVSVERGQQLRLGELSNAFREVIASVHAYSATRENSHEPVQASLGQVVRDGVAQWE